MGKAKKLKMSKKARDQPVTGLADQIESERFAQPSSREKHRLHQQEQDFVDSKLSRRILSAAVRQQQQLDVEDVEADVGGDVRERRPAAPRLDATAADSDPEDEDDSVVVSGDEICEDVEVDAADERALAQFMCRDPRPRRVLADIIMERIKEKETEIASRLSETQSAVVVQEIDPRVRDMYESIRVVLCKYRTGKIPKAFKVIPHMQNWEQMLHLTRPETWSAAAMYQATRMFASNLTDRMAQRFYNLVLLPRVRDDINFYKKLNSHLYLALKKALFKPGAFMKGILLPLCDAGDCTLREAVIVGSVLTRCSVPVLHASAAMLKMTEMSYTGATSIFLRVLLDKKFALPYRVVDAVHAHFIRFHLDDRELPVLWHQCLLVFVRRYKNDMSDEQRELLIDLTNTQQHHKITPEVRREIVSAKPHISTSSVQNMDT